MWWARSFTDIWSGRNRGPLWVLRFAGMAGPFPATVGRPCRVGNSDLTKRMPRGIGAGPASARFFCAPGLFGFQPIMGRPCQRQQVDRRAGRNAAGRRLPRCGTLSVHLRPKREWSSRAATSHLPRRKSKSAGHLPGCAIARVGIPGRRLRRKYDRGIEAERTPKPAPTESRRLLKRVLEPFQGPEAFRLSRRAAPRPVAKIFTRHAARPYR